MAERALPSGFRKVDDPSTLKALAHPVRIAILEVLGMEGPMTATEVSERIGESATTCSFHLRQLARYQFVEEAGGGKGRARPWRRVAGGLHFETVDDPESDLAAKGVRRILRRRHLDRLATWDATEHAYPRRWRRAAQESESVAYLTIEEFEQLGQQLTDLLISFRGRTLDRSKRPDGAVPVELLLFTYPLEPPTAGGSPTEKKAR